MVTLNNQNLQTSFDRDGYISINPLFSFEKVEEIKNELSRYIKEVAPQVPDHHIFYENKDDKTTIKQLQQMFTYDDYFKELIENTTTSGRLLLYVKKTQCRYLLVSTRKSR